MELFKLDTDKQRISQASKNKNDKQWYKNQSDLLDHKSFANSPYAGFGGVSEYRRKKVNYDLYNNIINLSDFEYVCKPYGSEVGDLPANFTNRDIISGKIKVLLGMEMKMPFSWKVVAVNEEATTRREQKESSMLKDFVVNQALAPLKQQIAIQQQEQQKGKQLTPQEQAEIEEQIQAEMQAKTPDEVKIGRAHV